MRDLDKIQEWRMVQMDTRRIAHVAGFGVVLIVVAFYAGVQVGKKAASSGALGPRSGESAALFKETKTDPSQTTHYRFESVLTAPDKQSAEAIARSPEPEPVNESGLGAPYAGQRLPAAAWQPSAPAQPAVPAPLGDLDAPDAKFTLQVKAFRSPADAEALATQLRANGYEAFVRPGEIGGKGQWHRVWVGRFSTMDLATGFQRDFESREGFSTLISPL